MTLSYQQTLQNIRKTIERNNNSFGQIGEDHNYVKFHNLDFYNWSKPKEEQEGTFVDLVGLPVKNGIEHGFYDYEQQIVEYLERDVPTDPKNKHLAIVKSAGLGITTCLLYYAAWRCTRDNAWSGGRIGILTSPRIDLAIDTVTRLKNIFTRNNLLQFDSRNTVCYLNNVTIEAFPSHLGIRSLRGYTDLKMIVCDEASWFNLNQNQEVIDTIERYYSKSNPIIVLCSTPQRIGDLLYEIKQQPELERFYHLMELSYKVGLGKIYTEQEIFLQKKSLSFAREFDLSFEAGIDGLFNPNDIDMCIADKYDPTFHNGLTTWCGIDPGYSTSRFAVIVIAWANGKLQVMKELEIEHADPDEIRQTIHKIIQEYNICRCFIDSSSVYLIRQLCKDYGIPDVTLWDDKTKDQLLQTNSCGGANLIHSVNFRTKHKQMLELLHKVISTNQIRIDPRFQGVINAIRTASTKQFGDVYDLDKKATASNDILDALRLSLLCLGLNS